MKIKDFIKTILLFLLTFLLGVQTTYAKTELVLPQKQVIFSVEQTPKASTLEKEVQPNVGFLKEKTKFVAVEGVSAIKTFAFAERVGGELAQGVDDILWTNIDEFDGLLNGKMVTYYDVNVTYQSSRVRAGMAFEEGGVLHFDINLPTQIQGQGVSSEIFQRAITDYSPSKVEGLWKSSGNYLGGESVNLTIFKQKVAEGLTDIQAVFETPTGKILKTNGFDGVPTILINTSDEVKVLFNPTN